MSVEKELLESLNRCYEIIETPPLCICKDCGKEFDKGSEGDNEHYCLRCEYIAGARYAECDE